MVARRSDRGNWVGSDKGDEWLNEMNEFLENLDALLPVLDVTIVNAGNEAAVPAAQKKEGIIIVIPQNGVTLTDTWRGKPGWLARYSAKTNNFRLIQPKNGWQIKSGSVTYQYLNYKWRYIGGETSHSQLIPVIRFGNLVVPDATYCMYNAIVRQGNRVLICIDNTSPPGWGELTLK